MSADETKPPEEERAPEDRDSGAMRALVQRATRNAANDRPPNLLPAVQRKIRKRSRGKFFADGFSTMNVRVNYMLIAIVMLGVIVVAYMALGPTGISR